VHWVVPGGNPHGDRTTPRGTRVATHLLWLVAAVMVPLLILTGVEIWRLNDIRRTDQESALLEQATAKAALLDQEFARIETALSALSASSALAEKDFDRFEQEMHTVSMQLGDMSIGLAGADGKQILMTSWPVGERMTGVITGPGAQAALTEGRITITNRHKSPLTGGQVTAVAVPIYRHDHSRPDYVITAVMPVVRLAGTIESQPAASNRYPDWILFDQDSNVVVQSSGDENIIGRQIRDPMLGSLRTGSSGFIRGDALIGGKKVYFAFARAQASGYTVAVGIPRERFDAPLRAGLIQTFAMGALLLGAGSLAAGLLAHRLVGALHRLATSPPRPPLCSGIREIDYLGLQLHRGAEERDRAQADLRQLNSELEQRVRVEVTDREAAQLRAAQAERTQALGQLAGGIAHDFNNILQVVAGSAALIDRRLGDASAVRRLVHQIVESADRGAAITRRMLLFARRGKLEVKSIDPALLLKGLRDICSYTLGPGIDIRVELARDLPRLHADQGQLETVLVNIASNARDAMSRGGIMTLSAKPEVVGAVDNHPAALMPGAYVRLSIADTGIGMDSAVLRRVAEPFFTTKGVGKGTGLGLAMAKGFAEQCGGGFSVSSQPGAGTIVSLWLPQADNAPAPARPEAVEDKAIAETGGRVLLVDDDDLVRETLAAQLEVEGYTVLSASSGEPALSLLRTTAPIDVLVTDLAMPGMDGLALIQAAQRLRSQLPVILLTGYAEDAAGLAVRGAISGSYSLIHKPVSGTQLSDRIAKVMESLV
jgi:signal transduction histidine kinase/ActR/RegA family two-component response regulator